MELILDLLSIVFYLWYPITESDPTFATLVGICLVLKHTSVTQGTNSPSSPHSRLTYILGLLGLLPLVLGLHRMGEDTIPKEFINIYLFYGTFGFLPTVAALVSFAQGGFAYGGILRAVKLIVGIYIAGRSTYLLNRMNLLGTEDTEQRVPHGGGKKQMRVPLKNTEKVATPKARETAGIGAAASAIASVSKDGALAERERRQGQREERRTVPAPSNVRDDNVRDANVPSSSSTNIISPSSKHVWGERKSPGERGGGGGEESIGGVGAANQIDGSGGFFYTKSFRLGMKRKLPWMYYTALMYARLTSWTIFFLTFPPHWTACGFLGDFLATNLLAFYSYSKTTLETCNNRCILALEASIAYMIVNPDEFNLASRNLQEFHQYYFYLRLLFLIPLLIITSPFFQTPDLDTLLASPLTELWVCWVVCVMSTMTYAIMEYSYARDWRTLPPHQEDQALLAAATGHKLWRSVSLDYIPATPDANVTPRPLDSIMEFASTASASFPTPRSATESRTITTPRAKLAQSEEPLHGEDQSKKALLTLQSLASGPTFLQNTFSFSASASSVTPSGQNGDTAGYSLLLPEEPMQESKEEDENTPM